MSCFTVTVRLLKAKYMGVHDSVGVHDSILHDSAHDSAWSRGHGMWDMILF